MDKDTIIGIVALVVGLGILVGIGFAIAAMVDWLNTPFYDWDASDEAYESVTTLNVYEDTLHGGFELIERNV